MDAMLVIALTDVVIVISVALLVVVDGLRKRD